ncbi:Phosphoethanolamine transferase EptA [Rickettsiales endosymbiont of Paramecium tredecaurelia]|uniref:phosphoethanolamine transferase n=1 Tax=Candidatus Sarmatiella mevalonica TaxID=2770581 RepID=UPI001921A881|nr:sulfatase-like hydrolase/transferase [Candidatus Sarmatiella mevalonica]MBL3285089.1 Phosphoethanolamine transferase EptA [Candidatus Sarmatiella mevalonica]
MLKKNITLISTTNALSFLNSCLFSYPLLSRIWHESNSIILLIVGFAFNFISSHLIYSLLFFPKTIKPLSYVFFAINGCVMYFINTYGIYLNTDMMLNVLSTDYKECMELLSGHLVYYILSSVTVAFLFWNHVSVTPTQCYIKLIGFKLLTCTICMFLFLLLLVCNYKSVSSFVRINKNLQYISLPSGYLSSAIRLTAKLLPRAVVMQKPLISLDFQKDNITTPSKRKKLVILIIGEAARAKNFSLNGYNRNTNAPLTDWQMAQQIVNLPLFYSCATTTALSVPCIFSHLPHAEFNLATAQKYENLLDLLQKGGVNVRWLDNNSGCQSVCNRVPNISYYNIDNNDGDEEVRDEDMLKDMDQLIDANADNLIILHQKGSHGPAYYKRVPEQFKKFMPGCNSVYFNRCSNDEIVNSYDNTIYYTSDFIRKSIEFLLRYDNNLDVALIYVSDHGESLGEKGLYLHGAPYFLVQEEQMHIPAIFWFSPHSPEMLSYKNRIMQKVENILSHDYIYHSILSLFQFTATPSYNSKLDLFAQDY